MHKATYSRINADNEMIWWLQWQTVGQYGWYMGPYATLCRFPSGHLGRYVSHSLAQAPYTSIRSIMHHLLSALSTYTRKCVHIIDA